MHHAHIDKFAFQDSWMHRLDSRAKLFVTFVFTVAVVALPRTSPILPCVAMIGPFAVLAVAGIPLRFVAKHVLWICPFVVVLALSCIWFDRAPMTLPLGPWAWHTTQGSIRALTVILKFAVTMSALIALVSTTRFNDLLVGLQRWHVPQILVIQLGFLYRYLFVLIDCVHHLLRARRLRRLRSLGWRHESHISAALVGSLLTRSLVTAERISQAMQVRGFTGQWPMSRSQRWQKQDWAFLGISVAYVALLVLVFTPHMQGGEPL
jgi:cobalt/nickel transport system permease protein